MIRVALMALMTWMFACGFVWQWWRCLKRGAIYSLGATYRRKSDPVGFCVAMSVLAMVILGLVGCAGAFTLDAMWPALTR